METTSPLSGYGNKFPTLWLWKQLPHSLVMETTSPLSGRGDQNDGVVAVNRNTAITSVHNDGVLWL